MTKIILCLLVSILLKGAPCEYLFDEANISLFNKISLKGQVDPRNSEYITNLKAALGPDLEAVLNSKLKPTGEIGKFIKASKANYIVRDFFYDHPDNPSDEERTRRLVVEVTPRTFPLWKKYFSNSTSPYLFHFHTPSQGTVMAGFQNRFIGGWGREEGNHIRFPSTGTFAPMMVFSNSEMKNIQTYFEVRTKLRELGIEISNSPDHKDDGTPIDKFKKYGIPKGLDPGNIESETAHKPWELQGMGFKEVIYGGECTAWLGEMPVGRPILKQIEISTAEGKSRVYNLKPVSMNGKVGKLFSQIWTYPYKERIVDLLKIPVKNTYHQNPGWLFVGLTEWALQTRVPVVFVFNDQKTSPESLLDQDPQLSPH